RESGRAHAHRCPRSEAGPSRRAGRPDGHKGYCRFIYVNMVGGLVEAILCEYEGKAGRTRRCVVHFEEQPLQVPEETARIARAAFPQGNPYLTMRDELGVIYQNRTFAWLFSHAGRRAEAPGNLALVLVMQYAEGLTDRQAAEAVRSRIDWKYALGLEMSDPGFHQSVLGRFRQRLLAGGAAQALLEAMLTHFQQAGLLSGRSQQRTDATHVVSAARELNRLELVLETLRTTLEAVAQAAPTWLQAQVTADWFDRYGERMPSYKLPRKRSARRTLAETIGQDGHHLLQAVYGEGAPAGLRQLPPVAVMRQVWVQQYMVEEGQARWRDKGNLPPGSRMIHTPYDPQARYSQKRDVDWVGYKVHLTECCAPSAPRLVTDVQTTPANQGDSTVVGTIHTALARRGLLPATQLVDAAYLSGANLANPAGVTLLGPVADDKSWQSRAAEGFALADFAIDWDSQTVTCPAQRLSRTWRPTTDRCGRPITYVRFARADCQSCSHRARCTNGQARTLELLPQPHFDARRAARQRQTTPEFWRAYRLRSGAEGTISQAVRSFHLRRSRYVGLAKTHLHNLLVAAAMNLTRAVAWLQGRPIAPTPISHFMRLKPMLT
ncbi:IS1182 family transposase, partial [Immundisolibacter sp.]|uniref:IS1182 family transposase n=1 Tax=Immundisolibacter sp. TaxID=1934948 RepID=UPI00356A95FD